MERVDPGRGGGSSFVGRVSDAAMVMRRREDAMDEMYIGREERRGGRHKRERGLHERVI